MLPRYLNSDLRGERASSVARVPGRSIGKCLNSDIASHGVHEQSSIRAAKAAKDFGRGADPCGAQSLIVLGLRRVLSWYPW